MSRAWWLGLAWGSLVMSGSCRQVADLSADLPIETCFSATYARPSCGTCIDEACCEEAIACGADDACASWLTCVAGCAPTDVSCRGACEQDRPFTEVTAELRACRARSCEGACELTCGGESAPGAGCHPCGDACCAAAKACAASVDCNHLDVCTTACNAGDDGCRARCLNEHPEGASLQAEQEECLTQRCDVEGDLSCLGSVEWAATDRSSLTIGLKVADLLTGEATPNLAVDACDHSDPSCSPPPSGSYVTDEAGRITVDLALTTGNYEGFFAFTGDEVFPLLWYFFPPLERDLTVTVPSLRRTVGEAIAAAANTPLDDERGHLVMELTDCRGALTPGLLIEASSADTRASTLYLSESLVIPGATSTGSTGRAAILNLPPGLTRVTVQQARTCRRVAEIDVHVRAGTFTAFTLPPTPRVAQ